MQEKTLLKLKTRTSNIHSSDFGSVSYDIFGSPYQKSGFFLADDSLDFGYLGKPYNADTELYDYGFRDYSPEIARFTTVDPIRDGRNWYSYVVNDPVNYVDLWGLCGSDREIYYAGVTQDIDNLLLYLEKQFVNDVNLNIKKKLSELQETFSSDTSACDKLLTLAAQDYLSKKWPNPDKYYVGPSKGKPNYIEELKTDFVDYPSPGLSFIFMEGGLFPTEPHVVGLLFTFEKGNQNFFTFEFTLNDDGSKREIVTNSFETFDNLKDNYGYDDFYVYPVAVVK